MKEARGQTACTHILPVKLPVVVAEQDLSQREQGMMKGKHRLMLHLQDIGTEPMPLGTGGLG